MGRLERFGMVKSKYVLGTFEGVPFKPESTNYAKRICSVCAESSNGSKIAKQSGLHVDFYVFARWT